VSGLADSGGSGAWLARLRRPLASLGLVSHDAPPRYGWNLPEDTTYARSLPGFSGVLHVFHGQWLGIRAAAGSLPGQKLAIDASRRPSRQDIEAFLAAIDARRLTRFVFHGMSDHAALLIRRLSQQGLAGQTFLVHHGGLAQWCYAPERKLAFQAIALAREGHVKRFHILKRNHGLLGEKSYIPMLLNMSPLMPEGAAGPEGPRAAAVFLPGTEGWIKNLHANALGAAMAEDAGEVLHYARGIALPEPWQERLRHVPYISRSGTFAHMAACRATLNVSLTECHPMVALESEAVGTPCLRARLFLDALEEHPYVRAVEVQDAASPFEIGLRLQYVLGIPEQECAAMIRDYQAALNEVSASRYKEFLGL
jgi:hypothetical protein